MAKLSTVRESIDQYISDNLDRNIEELGRLVAVPGISGEPEALESCARLTAELLRERGLAARLEPTAGAPVVLGRAGGKSDRVLLFYLHYDVQPADPLELWESPPFALTRRGDRLYGRGAADDKGHLVARLAAIDAVRHALGGLPCGIKLLVEGEEESGSPNLEPFIRANKEQLAADACIWESGGVDVQGAPMQVLGMRGICYVELSVETASQDAHSGLAGSVLPNAAWRLAWALNTLKDRDERILIAGFYDNVRPPTGYDLELLGRLADSRPSLQQTYGVQAFLGSPESVAGFHRQAVFQPTCTICGLTAGAQGKANKTIVPARASAKVDFRLVPDQIPADILDKLRAHLDAQGFADVRIAYRGSTRPARTDPQHPFVRLAAETAEEVYGRPPAIMPLIGGSGPNYLFIHDLGLPVASAGIGYSGSQIHAPNEHIRLEDFIQGIRHTAYLIEAFGRQ
jgi:acetylornithine deacetylase/succinyl-diaminopimelate desuccinylase-like protein